MIEKKQENRIALITGASRGIGAAIALELANNGFDIWLNYRQDHESARLVSRKIRESGVACRELMFNVSDRLQVENCLEPLLANQEIPFVLVNNAGITKDGIFAMMSPVDWTDVLDVSLTGFFNVTTLILPHMLRKRAGRIINIASTSGQTGVAGQVNYSAAKSGLIGATRSLAVEVARRNILVNAVAPGFIDTDMTSDLPKEVLTNSIPMQRFGRAEEVAQAVSFLASEKASYITGHVLPVNGGAYL